MKLKTTIIKRITLLSMLLFFVSCVRPQMNTADKIVVKTLSKTTKSWDKTPLPFYPKGKPEITILKVIIPPKAKFHLHKHPVISAGVILKGTLTLITDTHKEIELKSGDAVLEVVNQWHYGENRSSKPTEIIVFYAGEKGKAVTLLK